MSELSVHQETKDLVYDAAYDALRDYVDEMPKYGHSGWDEFKGLINVLLLMAVTMITGFMVGRESMRHYPDPVSIEDMMEGYDVVEPPNIILPPARPIEPPKPSGRDEGRTVRVRIA